jgi:hypothetical protein
VPSLKSAVKTVATAVTDLGAHIRDTGYAAFDCPELFTLSRFGFFTGKKLFLKA